MITAHGWTHPIMEPYGDLIGPRRESMLIGRPIVTDIGVGFRPMGGHGSTTSRGAGSPIIMADGSTSADTGIGHPTLTQAIDGREVGGDLLLFRSITMAAQYAGIRCLFIPDTTTSIGFITRDGRIVISHATRVAGRRTRSST